MIVKGNSVCPTCAPSVRQYGIQPQPVGAAAFAAAPSGQNAYGAPPAANTYGTPMPGTYSPPPPSTPFQDTSHAALAKARREDQMNLWKGLAVGLGIGTIGSIVAMKILFYAHFGISYLYILIGWGIGAGIWHFTNRGGTQLALSSITVMAVRLFFGHLSFALDVLSQARADGYADAGVTIFDAFPQPMAMLTPIHWLLIAIGMAACWRAADRQPT